MLTRILPLFSLGMLCFGAVPCHGAAPVMDKAWGHGTTITLRFSGPAETNLLTDPPQYSVASDGGAAVTVARATLNADGKTVNLTLASPLKIDTAYRVTMKGEGDRNTSRFHTWKNNPKGIKVFVLAGQSNMVGYGKVEEGGNPAWEKGSKDIPKEIKGGIRCLREMAVNDAKYPEYDYASLLVDPSKPKTSDWKTRPDVKLWWRNGGSGNLGGEIRKGDLGPLTSNGKWFGPEFAFGQILGDYYKNDDVLLIKTAWGGRALASDFRPPSAVTARGGKVGPFYKAIFDDVHEVLDNLGKEFPEWKGKDYQIVGFAWHQGFNDRVSKEFAPEYKDNLPDFIKDVRTEFGNPNLPFVIASTGMGNAGPVGQPPYESYTPVEKAQLWVAGVERPASVLSTDTRPFWTDPKDSPSTVGHHWNHSAQSYFLVGKAMGENMVKLLTK